MFGSSQLSVENEIILGRVDIYVRRAHHSLYKTLSSRRGQISMRLAIALIIHSVDPSLSSQLILAQQVRGRQILTERIAKAVEILPTEIDLL